MSMYRMQLLIKPDQRRRLERVARREGRTFSDVARRAIDEGLRLLEGESEQVWQERRETLEALTSLRKQVQEERGVYRGDLVAESRAERDAQGEKTWRNE